MNVERIAWCDEATERLREPARGDLHFIRAEVESGIAVLWRITGEAEGLLVTRTEMLFREVVLVVGAGKNCVPIYEHFIGIAHRAGFEVRTHIVRPGLERILSRLGLYRSEVVMRSRNGQQKL